MRHIVLLLAVLLASGCEYENNYYGFSDAGAVESGTDEDEMAGIWTNESKLFGQGVLALQAAPAAPVGVGVPWPFVKDTPAMQGSQTFLDLATADNRPHVVTLSFALVGQRPIPTPLNPGDEVVALINMGVGGLATYAEVDVTQGTQLSLAINRMQVAFVYRSIPNSVAVPVPAPTYTVGASAATGIIAHGRQPQRTYTKGYFNAANPALLLGGAADWWVVPPFAKSFKIVAIPNNSQINLIIGAIGAAFPGVARYNFVAYPSVDLPIPSGSYLIGLANVGVADVETYSLIFDLAL